MANAWHSLGGYALRFRVKEEMKERAWMLNGHTY